MAGAARTGLAALNAATGALDTAFNPSPSAGGVEAMVLTASGRLLLGGGFTAIGATPRNRLAAVNAVTGALDTAWAPSVGSQVFVTMAGLSTDGGNRVVSFNAATGAKQWEGTADGDVVALAVDGPTVYAGGHFDIITGSNITGENIRHHLAAFDAATGALKAWAPAVSGSHGVWTLWASAGSVIAGGDFQVVAATVSAGLARFPPA